VIVEDDVIPGGDAFRLVMRAPDGTDYPTTGIFREIAEPERLVFTSAALGEKCNPVFEGLTIVTFAEHDGKMELTLHTLQTSTVGFEAEAAQKLAGMEEGWAQSPDCLADMWRTDPGPFRRFQVTVAMTPRSAEPAPEPDGGDRARDASDRTACGAGNRSSTTTLKRIAAVHTSPANGLRPNSAVCDFFVVTHEIRDCSHRHHRFRRDPMQRGNEMVHAKRSSRPKAHLVFSLSALMTVSLAITTHARSTIAQAKGTSSRTKGSVEAKAVSPKMTKTATKPLPSVSIRSDLLRHLEEGQKGLQRQVESLTGMTQSGTDHLLQRIDSLNRQLNWLASTQQQSMAGQLLLTATIRSMRMLLMIIVALLLVLCGMLFFLAYRLQQFAGSVLNDGKQIGESAKDAPDGAFEAQWKVSS
jgi:uncharacterized protein YndB with AHSA1/START domain